MTENHDARFKCYKLTKKAFMNYLKLIALLQLSEKPWLRDDK